MKLEEVWGEKFQIEGISDIWRIATPMINEHIDNAPGYWCINQGNVGAWFANEVTVIPVDNDIVGEAMIETSACIQEEVQGWMSYEDSQKLQEKKDEMAKKVLTGEIPYEGYPGTAADKWYEEKLAEIGKIDYNQRVQETSWNQKLYTSLEEILEDLRQQKRHLTIMSKLHDTITAGYQIAKKLIEDPGYQISKIEKDGK